MFSFSFIHSWMHLNIYLMSAAKWLGEGNGAPLQYSCLENPMGGGAWRLLSMGSRRVRRLRDFSFTFHFHALEKEMATHSNVLAWRIPGMGEPGGLKSMGPHRVRHDWSDLAEAAAKWLLNIQYLYLKKERDSSHLQSTEAQYSSTIR